MEKKFVPVVVVLSQKKSTNNKQKKYKNPLNKRIFIIPDETGLNTTPKKLGG